MDHKPDNLEKGIRFGCGGLFGLFLGLYLMLDVFSESTFFATLTTLAIICLCGYFAMIKGDRFWSSIKSWLP